MRLQPHRRDAVLLARVVIVLVVVIIAERLAAFQVGSIEPFRDAAQATARPEQPRQLKGVRRP